MSSESNWRLGIDEPDPMVEEMRDIVFRRAAMGRKFATPLTQMTPLNPFVNSNEWGNDMDMDFSGAVSGLPTSSTFLGRGGDRSPLLEDELTDSIGGLFSGHDVPLAPESDPDAAEASPESIEALRQRRRTRGTRARRRVAAAGAGYNPWESIRQATVAELAAQQPDQWLFQTWEIFRACCSRQYRKVSHVANPLQLVVQASERSYGTGIASFYDLWLWIICMNFAIFMISFVFLIVPWLMRTDYETAAELWSPFATSDFYLGLLGLDEVEIGKTFFFYGGYAPGPDYDLWNTSMVNTSIIRNEEAFATRLAGVIPYEFRFFYPLTIVIWFIVCLGIIVCAIGVHLQVVTYIDSDMKFSTGVLTIWDHSVSGKAATESLRKQVASTFREFSEIDEENAQKQEADWKRFLGSLWSCCERRHEDDEDPIPAEERNRMLLLLLRRILGIFLTFGLLCVAITVVVFVTEYYEDLNRHFPLTAALIIATLIFFVERFLDLFVWMEGYVQVRVSNIHRTIRRYIIKVTLLISLIARVLFSESDEAICVPTYAGIMFWQLLVVDLASTVFTTVFSNFVYLAWNRGNKELSEMNISGDVNIVLYRQVVVFVGTIVSPMLPLLATVVSVILFLVQYFVMTATQGFPQKPIPNAKGDPFNLFVLLVTLLLSLIPTIIFFSKTGYGCGPASTTSLYSSLTVWELYDSEQGVAKFFSTVSDYLAVVFFVLSLIAIIVVYLLVQRMRMHERKFQNFSRSVQQERRVEESYHKQKVEREEGPRF